MHKPQKRSSLNLNSRNYKKPPYFTQHNGNLIVSFKSPQNQIRSPIINSQSSSTKEVPIFLKKNASQQFLRSSVKKAKDTNLSKIQEEKFQDNSNLRKESDPEGVVFPRIIQHKKKGSRFSNLDSMQGIYENLSSQREFLQRNKMIQELEKYDHPDYFKLTKFGGVTSGDGTLSYSKSQMSVLPQSFSVLANMDLQQPDPTHYNHLRSPDLLTKVRDIQKKTQNFSKAYYGKRKIKVEYEDYIEQNGDYLKLASRKYRQIPEIQLKHIFKKVEHLPEQAKLQFLDQELIKQIKNEAEFFEHLKQFFIKNNCIAVILQERRQPIVPILKIEILPLPEDLPTSKEELRQEYENFLQTASKALVKCEKVCFRHLFSREGEQINGIREIRPEMVYILLSYLPQYYGLDGRIDGKTLLKSIQQHVAQYQLTLDPTLEAIKKRNYRLSPKREQIKISNTISKDEIIELADRVMKESKLRDNSSSVERRINMQKMTQINVEQVSSEGENSQLPNEQELEELDQSIQKYEKEHREEFYRTGEKTLFQEPAERVFERRLASNSPYANYIKEQDEVEAKVNSLIEKIDDKLRYYSNQKVRERGKSIRLMKEKLDKERQEKQKEENLKTAREIKLRKKQEKEHTKLKTLIRVIENYLKNQKLGRQNRLRSQRPFRFPDRKYSSQKQQVIPNRRYIISQWDRKRFSVDQEGQKKKEMTFDEYRNFVDWNIKQNLQLDKNVLDTLGKAFDQNIPLLEQKSGFNRTELIQIFSKFKALVECTIKEFKFKGKNFDAKNGITLSIFKQGMPQLIFESDWLAKRVFEQCNDENGKEFIDWEHFLLAVKAIQVTKLDQKIDLFFKIIDSDGNGSLSYDEVYEICASSFEKFADMNDEILVQLTEFFASVIFRTVGKQLDEEIPLSEIKDAIQNNLPGADILCLFCNADYTQN